MQRAGWFMGIPQTDCGQYIQAGAKAKFGDVKVLRCCKAFGQVVTIQENMDAFRETVLPGEYGSSKRVETGRVSSSHRSLASEGSDGMTCAVCRKCRDNSRRRDAGRGDTRVLRCQTLRRI